jgi:hypothetical protein
MPKQKDKFYKSVKCVVPANKAKIRTVFALLMSFRKTLADLIVVTDKNFQ